MNILEIEYPIKVKVMHEDCNDCGEKFVSQPYEVYGAIGGFFCKKCIEKFGKAKPESYYS